MSFQDKDKEKDKETKKKPKIIKRPGGAARLSITNQVKANINKTENKKESS